MPRIEALAIDQADDKARGLLEGAQKALGFAPNGFRTLAHSPAALEAYFGFGKSLGAGSLSAKVREQIAVTVAGANSCEYCASAHTALGKKFGVDESELTLNLQGESADPKVQAALEFARLIATKRGWISDDEFNAVQDAGYSDGEIVEIIATVAINTFTNYFNHIAQTEIDFPVVPVETPLAAAR